MSLTTISKVGTNRGKARVWLEGARLQSSGFPHLQPYAVTYGAGSIVLTWSTDLAARRVAGTPSRPVIDLCAFKVGETLNHCDRVVITWAVGRIVIRPEVTK